MGELMSPHVKKLKVWEVQFHDIIRFLNSGLEIVTHVWSKLLSGITYAKQYNGMFEDTAQIHK